MGKRISNKRDPGKTGTDRISSEVWRRGNSLRFLYYEDEIMIEVRLFATFREGREKIVYFKPEKAGCTADILETLGIAKEEVAICLINGFHSKVEDPIKDGDVLALFPPVGGG